MVRALEPISDVVDHLEGFREWVIAPTYKEVGGPMGSNVFLFNLTSRILESGHRFPRKPLFLSVIASLEPASLNCNLHE